MSLKLGYVMTYYPSWQAYGQSLNDQTPSINDLENDNQQVICSNCSLVVSPFAYLSFNIFCALSFPLYCE